MMKSKYKLAIRGGPVCSFLLVAGIVFWGWNTTYGGELFPYPDDPLPNIHNQEQEGELPFYDKFRDKIRSHTCPELEKLKNGLVDRMKQADTKSEVKQRDHYNKLIRILQDPSIVDVKDCKGLK